MLWWVAYTLPFLSTPSARRATPLMVVVTPARSISIHALREEGDCPGVYSCPLRHHFYPRPPRGGRRQHPQKDVRDKVFLSTPSARRATSASRQQAEGQQFLSTPSARRATTRQGQRTTSGSDFYPRPPRGGRRCSTVLANHCEKFLSTPSARRATRSM